MPRSRVEAELKHCRVHSQRLANGNLTGRTMIVGDYRLELVDATTKQPFQGKVEICPMPRGVSASMNLIVS